MNRTRYILLLLVVIICTWQPCRAADNATAKSILQAMHGKIARAPALDVAFTIGTGARRSQGTVALAGAKFALSTPQISVWYDGRTQWTLLAASQEVSITEPTAAEVLATNPFAMLTAAASSFKAQRLPDVEGNRVVTLTPTDKSSTIKKYTIYVSPTTSWPTAIVVEFDDGNVVDVAIDNIATAKAKPDSTFSYNPKKYPAIEVVDLR